MENEFDVKVLTIEEAVKVSEDWIDRNILYDYCREYNYHASVEPTTGRNAEGYTVTCCKYRVLSETEQYRLDESNRRNREEREAMDKVEWKKIAENEKQREANIKAIAEATEKKAA